MPKHSTGGYSLPKTSWPESIPSIHEDRLLSVSIGNTHISWAVHEGIRNDLTPTLFWRTPHLEPGDLSPGEQCDVLASHIPEDVHALLFGTKAADASKRSALEAGRNRRVSILSVYVISTHDEQLQLFADLMSAIPTRIYLMQTDDFFTKEEGHYQGMGVDRLANLRASGDYYGFPALVFDGGTAATYSAADGHGRILGGGIGPGVQAKLRALSDYTSALPFIKNSELRDVIAELTDEQGNTKKSIPVFARTTKENIVSTVMHEMGAAGHMVIQQFLRTVGPAEPADDENENGGVITPTNKARIVIVTGGDADLLARLLEPDHSKLLDMEPDKVIPNPPQYQVKKMKHMIHYGIAGAIKRKIAALPKQCPDRQLVNLLIGQRVAKKFSERDEDGDMTFRGTVAAAQGIEKRFRYLIRYDDGDREDMDDVQLYDALELYVKVGEKSRDFLPPMLQGTRPNIPKGYKVDGAKMALKTLEDEKESVKKHIMDKKTAKKAPPPPVAKKSPPPPLAEKVPPPLATETGVTQATSGANKPAVAASNKRSSPSDGQNGPGRKKAKRVGVNKLTKPDKDYIGDRVAKYFLKELYFGEVTEYWHDDEHGNHYWHVLFDDGDNEDQEEEDLIKALDLYAKMKSKDSRAK